MPGNIFHFIMQNNNENKNSTSQNKNTLPQPESKNIFDNSNMENRYDLKVKNENSPHNRPNLLQRIINCFESESIIDIIN